MRSLQAHAVAYNSHRGPATEWGAMSGVRRKEGYRVVLVNSNPVSMHIVFRERHHASPLRVKWRQLQLAP